MIVLDVYQEPNRSEKSMTALAMLIQGKLADKNWSLRDLAAESGVPVSTLSGIMNTPNQEPRLSNLAAIADALDIPLRQVVEACGYPVTDAPEGPDTQARIQTLVGAVPDLRLFLENLVELTADDRAAVLALAEALVQKRRRAK